MRAHHLSSRHFNLHCSHLNICSYSRGLHKIKRLYLNESKLEDPTVQRVLGTRAWPTTSEEYRDMMESEDEGKRVVFTKRGDREAVRFNFYKNAFNLFGTDEMAV